MGPGLSSTLPPNNIKALYTHAAIHILVTATKKKETLRFWLHYRCYV